MASTKKLFRWCSQYPLVRTKYTNVCRQCHLHLLTHLLASFIADKRNSKYPLALSVNNLPWKETTSTICERFQHSTRKKNLLLQKTTYTQVAFQNNYIDFRQSRVLCFRYVHTHKTRLNTFQTSKQCKYPEGGVSKEEEKKACFLLLLLQSLFYFKQTNFSTFKRPNGWHKFFFEERKFYRKPTNREIVFSPLPNYKQRRFIVRKIWIYTDWKISLCYSCMKKKRQETKQILSLNKYFF